MPSHTDYDAERVRQEYEQQLERRRELERKNEELRRYLEQLKGSAKGH